MYSSRDETKWIVHMLEKTDFFSTRNFLHNCHPILSLAEVTSMLHMYSDRALKEELSWKWAPWQSTKLLSAWRHKIQTSPPPASLQQYKIKPDHKDRLTEIDCRWKPHFRNALNLCNKNVIDWSETSVCLHCRPSAEVTTVAENPAFQ